MTYKQFRKMVHEINSSIGELSMVARYLSKQTEALNQSDPHISQDLIPRIERGAYIADNISTEMVEMVRLLRRESHD